MIDKAYYLKLLTQRREWLFSEIKRSILDKRVSLDIIQQHEVEMSYIDEQKKQVERTHEVK